LIIIYKIFQNSCFIAMLLAPGLKARAIDFSMISGVLVVKSYVELTLFINNTWIS